MQDKKKLKLKKFYLHPITIYILLTFITILISGILSNLELGGTYNEINTMKNELSPKIESIYNMLSFDGIKFLISNASLNFLSFAPLSTLLISLIGLTIAEGTGFIETLTNRHLSKIPRFTFTFIILLIATISSLINEVGYAILIPLLALIYFILGRNPILGIITAFCGVSFGYGVSIFVGSMEVNLINYTKNATNLIDKTMHISLTSNLFFIIITSIIISIIGTIIIEKIIAPKIVKYKRYDEFAKNQQYNIVNLELEEQKQIEKNHLEKRGLRYALVVSIILLFLIIYSLIPNLPYSGILLDKNETVYVNQLFGENSYFQDGFTVIVSLFLIITSIFYGIGSKSIKSDKEIIENASKKFQNLGSLFILLFFASQFIAVFRKTNIATVITIWLTNPLEQTPVTGIPLILISLIFIALSNLFLTSAPQKWAIFSPVIVPMFMQSNLS